MADNCTEGHRKKAKYLLGEEELANLKRSKSSAPESSSEPAPAPTPTSEPFPTEPLYNGPPFDPNFPFGSEAANLEYSMLSAILGSPPAGDAPSPSQPPYTGSISNASWATDSLSQSQYGQSPVLGTSGYGPNYSEQQMSIQPPGTPLSAGSGSQMSPTFMDAYPTVSRYQQPQQEPDQQLQYNPQYVQQQQVHNQPPQSLHTLEPRYRRESRSSPTSNSAFMERSSSKDSIARALGSPASSSSPTSTSMHVNYTDSIHPQNSQPQSIDALVTRPYDYTEGYHFLMKHLPSRFEKNDILRIVRALAIFRPSLIAMQMPLTEEDEMFVEKCFQRSLMVSLHHITGQQVPYYAAT
jgi:hypothetical protein